VRLLLDTHVLIWVLEDSPRLSRRAREWVADPASECWVSAASVWEMAIKSRLGKLRLLTADRLLAGHPVTLAV
jgi:PIN domain nuclease of toxin-antitoxin system